MLLTRTGTILEFLGTLDILVKKYTPDTLPFHVVVPSLPGYGYSSGPPLDRDFTTENAAAFLDDLMVGLGFGDGYISQGGDIGSFLTRVLAVTSDHCKAAHSENSKELRRPRTNAVSKPVHRSRSAFGRCDGQTG
jgi:microsomal epoxide hydrolase